MFDPAPGELLRVLAEEGSTAGAARRLGVSESRLKALLRDLADKLDPRPAKPVPAPAPASEPAAGGHPRKVRLYTDGAARGNPGPAGAGAVLYDDQGKVLERLGRYLGVQTNNVAEYQGVLLGLERALEMGAKEIDVLADSLLVINQLKGEWKIKHEGLKPLAAKARGLLERFDRYSLRHVPREMNEQADEMSNRAIDERM